MAKYTIELILLGENGDKLWKFHGTDGRDAVQTMEQFASHLNHSMRNVATPPEMQSSLHSLFCKYGLSCPCTELGHADTLLVHLHHHMDIQNVAVEAYYPCVVAWSRHIDYSTPAHCHLCHQHTDAVRHITRCCFRSCCHRCIAGWGRLHTQCPHCGADMHFHNIQ